MTGYRPRTQVTRICSMLSVGRRCTRPMPSGRGRRTLSLDAIGCLPALAVGAVAGVLGFMPLMLTVVFARRGAFKPSIGKGLAALMVSFLFLSAFIAFAWKFIPGFFLATVAGMVVGFFAMWALLAFISIGRR